MNTLLTAMADSLVCGLAQAQVNRTPCPHLAFDLDNAEALEALHAHLPEASDFRDEGHGLQVFPCHEGAADLATLDPGRQMFYQRLNTEVFSPELAQAFVDKFRPAMAEVDAVVFGEGAAHLEALALDRWSNAGAINIRQQGSCLPVHLDWPNRLISVVIYLGPEEGWQAEWGTRLYRIDRQRISNPQALMSRRAHLPEGAIDMSDHHLIPFRPGRVVAFLNSPWSHHGAEVTPSPQATARRWCLVKGINLDLALTQRRFGLPPELEGST